MTSLFRYDYDLDAWRRGSAISKREFELLDAQVWEDSVCEAPEEGVMGYGQGWPGAVWIQLGRNDIPRGLSCQLGTGECCPVEA